MRPDFALRAASKRCSYPLALFLRGEDFPCRSESWPLQRNGLSRGGSRRS